MKHTSSSRLAAWFLVASFGVAARLLAVTPTQVERIVDAPADGVVEITNISGSVSISGWDRSQVRVRGTLGPEVEALLVDAQASRVLVAVIIPRFHSGEIEAQLRVDVPRGSSRVRVESVSAAVDVAGVDGSLDLETVSGLIDVEGSPRSVKARTVGGPIDVEGRPRTVDVTTVSGRVEIEAHVADVRVDSVNGAVRMRGGVHGKIHASSVSGDLIVQAGEIAGGVFETVSGAVRVGGALALGGSLEAGSQQSDVELRLPPSTSAVFDLRTQVGDLRNDFGPEPRRERRATVLEFTEGGGDGSVIALSYSGDVSLLRP